MTSRCNLNLKYWNAIYDTGKMKEYKDKHPGVYKAFISFGANGFSCG